jgi:hypothetical protein
VSDRPKVTRYLVMWPDKKIGGFEREDVLMIALAENRSMGEAQVFKLTCTLPTIYEPIASEEVREIAFPKPDMRHLDNPAASFAEAMEYQQEKL